MIRLYENKEMNRLIMLCMMLWIVLLVSFHYWQNHLISNHKKFYQHLPSLTVLVKRF